MDFIKYHYKADSHGRENELIYSDEFVIRQISRTSDSLCHLCIYIFGAEIWNNKSY